MRWALVASVCLVACGRVGFDVPNGGTASDGGRDSGDGDDGGDDGGSDAAMACETTAWGSFTIQTNLATGNFDWDAAISPDGLTIVYASNRDAPSLSLFVATRATRGVQFGSPTHLTAFDVASDDISGPTWSSDGQTIYFTDHQPSTNNLWNRAAYLGNGAFAAATTMEMHTADDNVVLATGGNERFFNERPASVTEIAHQVRANAAAVWTDDPLPTEISMGGATDNGWVAFNEARQEIYWERGYGPVSIMSTTRTGPGQPFDTNVISHPEFAAAGDPDMTADGLEIVFASQFVSGITPVGSYDIYTATRSCL